MCKCLYCYRPLREGEKDFHPACARKFFGSTDVPDLEYTAEQLDSLALEIIRDSTSLTGVQPKLSLHLTRHSGSSRLTIVGLWGAYICKPQTPHYPELPENEDLTMHLASLAHIAVVPHTLMHMADGSLCYLTRRIDRLGDGSKLPMEDLCQLTGRQTEHKYRSSYERAGKAVMQYSSLPRLDVAGFFETVFFCYLTGNNDMHLKNFSLYEPEDGTVRLMPAYDLLSAAIANPADPEELALTLNGRKRKLGRDDFLAAAKTLGIDPKTVLRLIEKYRRLLPSMEELIKSSFLSTPFQDSYISLIHERLGRL